MKRIGKIGRINSKANKKIAQMWLDMGIHFCEICTILADMGLLKWQCLQSNSPCHRHGRVDYRTKSEMLYNYNQVVRGCVLAHEYIDRHTNIREKVFIKLRGKDLL